MYAFDLSPSLQYGEQLQMAKSDLLSKGLKFVAATLKPAHVIIYAEMDSMLEISKTRQGLIGYSA